MLLTPKRVRSWGCYAEQPGSPTPRRGVRACQANQPAGGSHWSGVAQWRWLRARCAMFGMFEFGIVDLELFKFTLKFTFKLEFA